MREESPGMRGSGAFEGAVGAHEGPKVPHQPLHLHWGTYQNPYLDVVVQGMAAKVVAADQGQVLVGSDHLGVHGHRPVRAAPLLGPVPQAYLIGHLSERRSEEHTSELQSRFDLVCRL